MSSEFLDAQSPLRTSIGTNLFKHTHLLIEVHGLSGPSVHLDAPPEPLQKKRKLFTDLILGIVLLF